MKRNLKIGDSVKWTIPAVNNGVGMAGKAEETGLGKLTFIGRKYGIVDCIIWIGPTSFPATYKVLLNDLSPNN